MLGILLAAGVMGLIIAMMEEGEFPGWLASIGCVLAGSLPTLALNLIGLNPFLSLAAGAVCASGAISFLTGMGFKRAMIAAGIYFAVMVGFQIIVLLVFKK